MFPELVMNLTLDKIGICFPNLKSIGTQPEMVLVSDLLTPLWLPTIDDPRDEYSPDFFIKGNFRYQNHFMKDIFTISEEGKDILFITGIPKNSSENLLSMVKIPNAKFMTYWEDSKIGYLTQIIDTE